jgi:hypothetical protein
VSWNPLSPPFTLKQGTLYACNFKLSFLEKAALSAEPDVVTEKAAQQFADAGFTGVTVDMTAFRAEGTWGKSDQADVTLPSQVTMVYEWDPETTQP